MSVTVKSMSLWRKEAENRTGLLAQTLEPLAKARADLGVVLGYRLPGNYAKAAIEVYPVSGERVTAAAAKTGLAASSIPTLLVEGDNRPGLAQKMAQTTRRCWSRPELFRCPSNWQKVFGGHRLRN